MLHLNKHKQMQPTPKKKKNSVAALLALIFFILIILTGGALYQKKQAENLHIAQIEQETLRAERAQLDALFAIYIDDFTADLAQHAKTYRESRSVLSQMISPYNFETLEYAKENYTLFKTEIAPSLRKQATDIINIFQIYTDKLKHDLKSKDSDLQSYFLAQWKDMSQTQLNDYINFFTKEENLIRAYDDLITFYYVHSKLYTVDIENNLFLFTREQDQKQEQVLLQTLRDLKEKPAKNQ